MLIYFNFFRILVYSNSGLIENEKKFQSFLIKSFENSVLIKSFNTLKKKNKTSPTKMQDALKKVIECELFVSSTAVYESLAEQQLVNLNQVILLEILQRKRRNNVVCKHIKIVYKED